jgi:vacuolar-type H+-ATPase subunit D/Vma8
VKRISLINSRIRAFRSFVEEAFFEFPETGLRIIRGRNADTGGSSGAGKTSVILGPTYAMGYCPFPATELQSWFTDEKPFAGVWLKTPDRNIIVDRGDGLKLTIGDEKALKGKAAEARLTQELGLTPAMLSALTYREQRSDGTFLSKTNVEIQSFLTAVLALEPFEQAYDSAMKAITYLEKEIQTSEGRLQVLKAQLDAAQLDLHNGEAEYEPLDLTLLNDQLAKQKEELARWRGIRTAVQEKRDAYQLEYRQAVSAQLADKRSVLKQSQDAVQTLRVVAAGGPSINTDIARVKRRRETLENQMRVSATGICPTCKQPWEKDRDGEKHSDAIDEEHQQLGQELVKLAEAYDRVTLAKEQADELQTKVFKLEQLVSDAEAEASKAFADNLEALKRAYADAEQRVANAEYLCNSSNTAIQQATALDVNVKSQLEFRRKRVADVQKSVETETKVLERHQVDIAKERDFAALVGRDGFLGAIFDEVLAEVAEETNDILAKVPNVAHVTLAFKSETITGKGTVQRGIKPVVTVGGHEASLKAGCSGGMLGAVYLATDLAVIDVVSRRLGVSPGWLFLDESFEGLGAVEKEAYLEVLSLYAEKKLVLIIDHGTETKEALPGIDLIYENGRSRLA